MKLLDTYSENRTGWAVVYTFAFIITFILGLENEKPID